MDHYPKISIVSPVYYGETMVEELVGRLNATISKITGDFEIILVDDGSPDNSWNIIQHVCKNDPKVKGVKLSRNFGQHYAITAGLEKATGEWVIVMDCDLQDLPEEIPPMWEETKKGYEIILAKRVSRQDNFFKKASSRLFYSLYGYLTESRQDASVANFGIYHRKVIQAVLAMKDKIRSFPTMVQWVGFSTIKVNVKHGSRHRGKSTYTLRKLILLAVNNIIAFSDKPLRLTVYVGMIISLFSFIVGLYYLHQYFTGSIIVMGYASMIISIWFLSGLIIFILGILGIYIGKTFDRVKDRPIHIIDSTINF